MGNEIDDLKRQIEELKAQIGNSSSTAVSTTSKKLNEEENTMYEWDAPVRVFNPWERQKITSVILGVALLSLVLVLLKEFPLLLTTILVTFVGIALVIVPPAHTKHKITNKGIHSFDKLYTWDDLSSFWITKKHNSIVLYINTKVSYPEKLFFILPEKDIKPVLNNLTQHLKYFERREKQSGISRINDGEYLPYNQVVNL